MPLSNHNSADIPPQASTQRSTQDSAQASDSPASESGYTTVTCEDRWQVYHRLQSLSIPCQCSGHQPLKVRIQSPAEALQLWSIIRQVTLPRPQLAEILNHHWQQPAAERKSTS